MSGLRDRHAIVTGGGSGIGLAIAAALTGAGARVTVIGRRGRSQRTTTGPFSLHTARAVVSLMLLRRAAIAWSPSRMRSIRLTAAMPMLSDPVSFAANMQVWSKHLPERFLPLIEAGVKDGSIPTEYPREAAELLSLLPNYWLMPYFYPVTLPEMEHRIRCLATMLDAIGVPIFDDELITVAAKGMMTFAGEPEKGSE